MRHLPLRQGEAIPTFQSSHEDGNSNNVSFHFGTSMYTLALQAFLAQDSPVQMMYVCEPHLHRDIKEVMGRTSELFCGGRCSSNIFLRNSMVMKFSNGIQSCLQAKEQRVKR
jgi:hypothetical protein